MGLRVDDFQAGGSCEGVSLARGVRVEDRAVGQGCGVCERWPMEGLRHHWAPVWMWSMRNHTVRRGVVGDHPK